MMIQALLRQWSKLDKELDERAQHGVRQRHATLFTGIACLPQLTVNYLQGLCCQQLDVRPPALPDDFALLPPNHDLIVYVAVAGLYTSNNIWKSFGYRVFIPSTASGNFYHTFAGPDQCSLRAGLCGVLACCLRFAQPLIVRVFSSELDAWWHHDFPLSFRDGDHLDLQQLFRAHIPTREFPVRLELSQVRDTVSILAQQSTLHNSVLKCIAHLRLILHLRIT